MQLPAGTFDVGDVKVSEKVIVVGAGYDKTILRCPATASAGLVVDGVAGVSISGLTVQGGRHRGDAPVQGLCGHEPAEQAAHVVAPAGGPVRNR